MSSCGLEFRFYFEIGVILVIALIVYIFVFIALGVGKFLWHIQEKLNRHELSLGDRNYDPHQSKGQQTIQAPYIDCDNLRPRKATTQVPCTNCDDLRSKNANMKEESWELREEKNQSKSALRETSRSMEALNLQLGKIKEIKESPNASPDENTIKDFNESFREIKRIFGEISNYVKRESSS